MHYAIVKSRGTKPFNANSRSIIAPTYLKFPTAIKAPPVISGYDFPNEFSSILSVLHEFHSVDKYLNLNLNAADTLKIALSGFFDSIIPVKLQKELSMYADFLPGKMMEDDCYEIPEHAYAIGFNCNDFCDNYYTIGKAIEKIENNYPRLGKTILDMIDECPISIATPWKLYAMTGYYFWFSEESSDIAYENQFQEYLRNGESEEDAQEYANQDIQFSDSQFEEHFPEWTFQPALQTPSSEYRNVIPDEFTKLFQARQALLDIKVNHHVQYYQNNFPAIFTIWQEENYDFACDVVNSIGDMQCQAGEDYTLSGMLWALEYQNPIQIRAVFNEMKVIFTYFSEIMKFLESTRNGS